MSDPHHILTITTLLGALGMWLMLPRGASGGRGVGIILAVTALGLGASQVPRLGDWVADSIFLVLAGTAVVSAAAAVTFRNPLYCAIWFGLSLLGIGGLFFFDGAQFLAVATVVVYAGAILVTFLFVLMLAQPEGKAPYDRVSWEALLSAFTGIVIIGVLSMTIGGALTACAESGGGGRGAGDGGMQIAKCKLQNANCQSPNPEIPKSPNPPPTTNTNPQSPIPNPLFGVETDRAGDLLASEHVARFGAELFGRHLIAIEVAGVLLLAALVAAAAIVAQKKTD